MKYGHTLSENEKEKLTIMQKISDLTFEIDDIEKASCFKMPLKEIGKYNDHRLKLFSSLYQMIYDVDKDRPSSFKHEFYFAKHLIKHLPEPFHNLEQKLIEIKRMWEENIS